MLHEGVCSKVYSVALGGELEVCCCGEFDLFYFCELEVCYCGELGVLLW